MAETSGGHAAEQHFPENLRAMREAKGISQAAIAKAMRERGHSWHQTTVARVEAGRQPPGLGETVDLAAILGVTVDRLTWPGPEAAEHALIARAAGALRTAWRETAAGSARLQAARESAERTAAERAKSRYPRVRDAARGLAEELGDCTLQGALAEGAAMLERTRNGEA